ncbi:MAG: nitronate monooxygenase [Syntrophales bacterium]|nr:nitronate monooxygenase [Syntrophales bacterium]
MIQTRITEMFGIRHPVLCAVSEAGGMGNLTAANYETEEAFRSAIGEVRKMTDKPFMVNVTILPSVRISGAHHKMYLRVCAEERVAGVEISGAPIDKACGPESPAPPSTRPAGRSSWRCCARPGSGCFTRWVPCATPSMPSRRDTTAFTQRESRRGATRSTTT